MPWGAAIGAIGAIGAASISSDKDGGAGTTTASKEPWAAAQPWLMNNINRGQDLQQRYQDQPFSTQQQNAYDNSYAQSDYMRSLVPSLLGQIQAQPLGYDKDNPTAKAQGWNWSGLLGDSLGLNQKSVNTKPEPVAAPAPAAAAPALDTSSFRDTTGFMDLRMPNGAFLPPGSDGAQWGDVTSGNPAQSLGGFGSWKYGQQAKPGTQQDNDMRMYFAMGGQDPNRLYANFGKPAGVNLLGNGGN
jgi:hypothetical protein